MPTAGPPTSGSTARLSGGTPARHERGMGMDWFDTMQWPAMAVTLAAAWLIGSSVERRRNWGFWLFLLSNLLWIAWGTYVSAWALVALQVGLALMNIRGARKTADA